MTAFPYRDRADDRRAMAAEPAREPGPTYLFTLRPDPEGPPGSILVHRHPIRPRRGGFGDPLLVGRAASVADAVRRGILPRGATRLDNLPGPADEPGVFACYLSE
jgi:hypothetical protein